MQSLWFVGNTHLNGIFDNIASQKMYNISRVFMTFFCFLSPKADRALQYVCLNCAKILSDALLTYWTSLNFVHIYLNPSVKLKLRKQERALVAIISSYNDILSAHQPFENFPNVIKQAIHDVGAVAQFAGGVPAMCDGVTQGQPGMELSLF